MRELFPLMTATVGMTRIAMVRLRAMNASQLAQGTTRPSATESQSIKLIRKP